MRSIYHPELEQLSDMEQVRLAKVEERTKESIRRLDRLETLCEEVHTQNEKLARLIVRLESVTEKLNEQEKRLAVLENIPMKLAGAVITALVSAFVGGAMTVLF